MRDHSGVPIRGRGAVAEIQMHPAHRRRVSDYPEIGQVGGRAGDDQTQLSVGGNDLSLQFPPVSLGYFGIGRCHVPQTEAPLGFRGGHQRHLIRARQCTSVPAAPALAEVVQDPAAGDPAGGGTGGADDRRDAHTHDGGEEEARLAEELEGQHGHGEGNDEYQCAHGHHPR